MCVCGGGGGYFWIGHGQRLVVSNVNSSQKSKSIRVLLELLIILAKIISIINLC